MQDFFHADTESAAADEPINETAAQDEAPSDSTEEPSSARPAATASSYRDIIAERLARKSGSAASMGAVSPLAHSSDVQRSAAQSTAQEATEPTLPTAEAGIPSVIEASTRMQEIPASATSDGDGSQAGQGSSSRERARARQQERAALRRGGERRTRPEIELQLPEDGPVPAMELTASEESDPAIAAERG